jgi:hypothetical protein
LTAGLPDSDRFAEDLLFALAHRVADVHVCPGLAYSVEELGLMPAMEKPPARLGM